MFHDKKKTEQSFDESSLPPLWKMIKKNIEASEKIIELGCGTGQFAKYLHTNGYNYCLGVDFSMRAIEIAKKTNISLNFICENAFHFLKISPPFDTIIITNVLEVVTYDIDLIAKIPIGKKIILSVPCFDSPTHLRYFETPQQALSRYGQYFKSTNTETYKHGKQQWLLITSIKK